MGKNRTKINHAYNFAGGDKLKTMGAAWFVGFCYAKFVNPLYDKWIWRIKRVTLEGKNVCRNYAPKAL